VTVLELRQVNQFYGESHILWDVDLEVPEGSCTCLMGRNGVGKTTLLKTIMGTLKLASGSMRFSGDELASTAPQTRARLGIGYVPQGREIFPLLTVEENLRIGLPARRDRQREIPKRVFELFPVLKRMLRRRGGDLSGGQQQQLAIGRALALSPKLLILDEPTEGIQPSIVHEIGEILRDLNRTEKLTVLLVEQKLPFARRLAERFTILNRGRVAAAGSVSELDDRLARLHLGV
jgi:urea transport system ATP-binding protein